LAKRSISSSLLSYSSSWHICIIFICYIFLFN
jgi:hypothetical protein